MPTAREYKQHELFIRLKKFKIFTEDDCAPDAETAEHAYHRLFGTTWSRLATIYDGGDCFAYLGENAIKFLASDGSELYSLGAEPLFRELAELEKE